MDKYRMCTATKYTKTFIHNLYRENVCHAFHTPQGPMRGGSAGTLVRGPESQEGLCNLNI